MIIIRKSITIFRNITCRRFALQKIFLLQKIRYAVKKI